MESSPAPWTPHKRGQPPYPPKAMVTLLLLKTWLGMDYRSISADLHAFPEQRMRIGLEKTPSHTAIRSHMLRLPEAYLRKLHGTNSYETWLTVKGKLRRHRYLKLHQLVALQNLAILNRNMTRGTRNDSPILKRLLKPIPRGGGDP